MTKYQHYYQLFFIHFSIHFFIHYYQHFFIHFFILNLNTFYTKCQYFLYIFLNTFFNTFYTLLTISICQHFFQLLFKYVLSTLLYTFIHIFKYIVQHFSIHIFNIFNCYPNIHNTPKMSTIIYTSHIYFTLNTLNTSYYICQLFSFTYLNFYTTHTTHILTHCYSYFKHV